MTRFAALCYAITAIATGSTAFQPPSLPLRPVIRTSSDIKQQSISSSRIKHHESLLIRRSSTHNHDDDSYQLEKKTWMFQDKYPISYDIATTTSNEEDVATVPVLLLNGFGVGSFHQHRLASDNSITLLPLGYFIYNCFFSFWILRMKA